MEHRMRSAALVIGASLIGAPLHAQEATPAKPATPAATAENDTSLEEIVVTARKRSEKLSEVPAAVTAFTEQDIKDAGIKNTRDFIAATPNVELVETQQVGTAFVIIRGIEQARNSEPSVATVVDGVNQTFAAAFSQDLYDIDSIEVLKGPQGGLYGRNAIGGAIIINTAQPTDQYEGAIRLGGDNGPGYVAQASLSGPIPSIDTLKFSAMIVHNDTDGWIQNTYLNHSADPSKNTVGRFKILWQASDDLTIVGTVSENILRTRGYYYNIVADVNDTSLPVEVNNDGEDNRDLVDASVKADYNLGFATLTSVTAYDTLTELISGDSFPFLPIPQAIAYATKNEGFTPAFDENQDAYTDTKAVSEDIRLTSPNEGTYRWIVGGYAIHTDRYYQIGNMADFGKGLYPPYRVPNTNPNNPQVNFLADSQFNTAWATYGDLTAELTDQLEAQVSLRYDSDGRQNVTDTPTAFLPNVPGFPQGFSGQVREKTFGALQPKVTLRWIPEPGLTLYADYGRGFRSGGFNATGVGALAAGAGIKGVGDVFQAEVADTIEAGVKAELMDRRLTIDWAVFGTQSKNPYFFVFLYQNATQNLGNIEQVQYEGTDFAVSYKATSKLRFDLGFGYTNSDITKSADPTVIGNQAPDVTDYNINFAAQYSEPIGDNFLIARGEYQRLGDTWWDPQNSTVRNPVDLVNTRLAFETETWEAAFWVKNLFDKQYNAEFSPGGFVFKALPRRFGVDVTYKF